VCVCMCVCMCVCACEHLYVFVCVCVCVRERERVSERHRTTIVKQKFSIASWIVSSSHMFRNELTFGKYIPGADSFYLLGFVLVIFGSIGCLLAEALLCNRCVCICVCTCVCVYVCVCVCVCLNVCRCACICVCV